MRKDITRNESGRGGGKRVNYLDHMPALLMLNIARFFSAPCIRGKVAYLDLNSTMLTGKDQEAIDNVFCYL